MTEEFISDAEIIRRDAMPVWQKGAVGADELQRMHFDPLRYLLPGYIPEGVTILAGKPKLGKSWTALDLCIAAAANRFTLGTLKPAQGDVLYVALEDSKRRLKSRMTKLMQGGGAWPPRLALQTDWRRADEGEIEDLNAWCQSVEKPTLIVIDTLEKFRAQPKTNSSPQYSTDYQATGGLQALTKKYPGLAVIVLHHVRKMDAEDPFDMISGTLGLTGAADTLLVMLRKDGVVTLHVRGRDVEESEPVIQFNKATCRWTMLGQEAVQAVKSAERQKIIDVLRAFEPNHSNDGMGTAEIMTATGRGDRKVVDNLLYKMTLDGEIRRVRRGVYDLPQNYPNSREIREKERNFTQAVDKSEENVPDQSLGQSLGSEAERDNERSAERSHIVDLPQENANLSDLSGLTGTSEAGGGKGATILPLDQPVALCAQCGAPGELTSHHRDGDDRLGWLHAECVKFWKSAADDDLEIPEFLRRPA